MIKFLDAELADDNAQGFIAALQQEQAQAFAFYLGGDDTAHVWPVPVVEQVRRAGFQAKGIWLPRGLAQRSGADDGAIAAQLARSYGLWAWRLVFDLEPAVYDADPAAAVAYAGAWAPAVRAAGLSPELYGAPPAIEACWPGYDVVWGAVPGDAAWTFRAVPSAVQYGSGSAAGVSYDVSLGDFPFTPPGGGHMRFVLWNGVQQLFRIEPGGTLVQAWTTGDGRWQEQDLGVGYLPGSLEVQRTMNPDESPNQLHLFAQRQDGSVAHFWQVAGAPSWSTESVPAA